jgi:hypothetical protein
MVKKFLTGVAFLLALSLVPVVPAEAHDRRGRGRGHGRGHGRDGRVIFVNNRNPTPGVLRRVRRGWSRRDWGNSRTALARRRAFSRRRAFDRDDFRFARRTRDDRRGRNFWRNRRR